MSCMRRIVILSFCALLTLPIYAQTAGSPDVIFGQNGEVLFQPALPNGGTPSHRNSVLQSDGKIVTLLEYGASVSLLNRLNHDGSLDSSFGNGGYVYLSWNAFAMAKQIVAGEERILAAGSVACGRNSCLHVERYTPTGALDTTFGTAGSTTISGSAPYGFAVQPSDQKILMAERSNIVRRLSSNGAVDSTFGTNGVSSVSGLGLIGGLTVAPSGRILVCGSYAKGKSSDFAIARLNTNGTLDDGSRNDSTPGDSFGSSGRATTDFGGNDENAYSAAIDTAGRIVASGQAQMGGSTYRFANAVLVRYSSGGQIDSSFGSGGKASLDMGGAQDIFKALAFQADGKIVATGEGRFADTAADILTARYNDDGTIDTSFGNGGWIMKDMYGLYDAAPSILIQSDPSCGCEKIIVAGNGATSTQATQAVVLRYIP